MAPENGPRSGSLRADAEMISRRVSEQTFRLVLACVVCATVGGCILWVEYRAVILALLLLIWPAILAGDLARLLRARREGFVVLRWSAGGVTVETAAGSSHVPVQEIAVARVTPRHLVLASKAVSGKPMRVWIVPGGIAEVGSAGEALAGIGVNVVVERGAAAATARIAMLLVLWRVLGLAGAAAVMGGLAAIALFFAGKGGSPVAGVLLVAGGFVSMVLAAIARIGLTSPPAVRPPPKTPESL